MKIIQIKKNNWKLKIDLIGGRIVELRYGKRKILGTYKRIDGKTGNTHICVPNFGNEGGVEFGLPFHGGGRNKVWETEGRGLRLQCLLQHTEKYRTDLLVCQTFTFQKNSFIHEVVVEHLAGEPVPLNIGIHNYWDTPNGWDGILVNNENVTEQVKKNGIVSIKRKNVISLPHKTPILWETQGFLQAVLWASFKGDEFDPKYVCIEPIRGGNGFWGSTKSIISPQKKVVVVQKISIPLSQLPEV
jgi:galactose mutarotase-like enzyme